MVLSRYRFYRFDAVLPLGDIVKEKGPERIPGLDSTEMVSVD
jgi:hypothetical protein